MGDLLNNDCTKWGILCKGRNAALWVGVVASKYVWGSPRSFWKSRALSPSKNSDREESCWNKNHQQDVFFFLHTWEWQRNICLIQSPNMISRLESITLAGPLLPHCSKFIHSYFFLKYPVLLKFLSWSFETSRKQVVHLPVVGFLSEGRLAFLLVYRRFTAEQKHTICCEKCVENWRHLSFIHVEGPEKPPALPPECQLFIFIYLFHFRSLKSLVIKCAEISFFERTYYYF